MTTASGTPAQITVQMEGIQGAPGAQGPPGDQGLPGSQGEQGVQGIQGEEGPPGQDGTTIPGSPAISLPVLGSDLIPVLRGQTVYLATVAAVLAASGISPGGSQLDFSNSTN